MKIPLTGYIAPSLEHLKSINTAITNPLLVHTDRCWYILDSSLDTNTIDTVNTPVGRFQAIPVDANNSLSYQYASIDVNTSLTTLDFSTLPRCVEINLNINTVLQVTNLQRYSKYLIKINFNDYVIENLTNLFNLPNHINWQYFNTNYNYLLIEIEYINNIVSDVLFPQLRNPSLAPYNEHTNTIIFDTNLWTNSVDTSANAYTGEASGAVIYSDGVNLQGNRIAYIVDNAFNMNEVNFSIEAFIRFFNSSDYGTIFSRWSDSSKQFWLRIDTAKVLTVSINEGTSIVNLTYNLTSLLASSLDYVHILVTRTLNIYKLFINGVLVDSVKSTPFMVAASSKVVIGKLENSPLTGDVGNTSFSGIIREIKVTKAIKNNYDFNYIYPKNSYGTDVVFLLQNSLTERVTNSSPIFTSTVNTEPVTGTSDRRTFSPGTVNTGMLNKKHHLEYGASSLYEITGNVTIEGWIRNYTGNTRGTIIYYGDSTNFNFHVGIYDSALRFAAKNDALVITSSINVPLDVWTHFAFVREDTDNRLYINGLYAGNASSSEVLNFYGTSLPMCIKRLPSQNDLEANLNTSLYPSKSHIDIEGLRITKRVLYTGVDTINPNFLLPGEFSYR